MLPAASLILNYSSIAHHLSLVQQMSFLRWKFLRPTVLTPSKNVEIPNLRNLHNHAGTVSLLPSLFLMVSLACPTYHQVASSYISRWVGILIQPEIGFHALRNFTIHDSVCITVTNDLETGPFISVNDP